MAHKGHGQHRRKREFFDLPRMKFSTCAKVAYQSRSDAKKAARFVRVAHGRMRPYRCPTCGFWHIGHLPASIRVYGHPWVAR